MLILEVISLVVSLVAIFVAWRVTCELRQFASKLDRLQTTLFETRQEQRTTQQEMSTKLATLDVAVQKATGKLKFDPNASLVQLFQVEPRAESVLAAFHIGGCADCAVDENSTLAQAVRERGANMDQILTALNALPDNGGSVNLRMPNVKFDL